MSAPQNFSEMQVRHLVRLLKREEYGLTGRKVGAMDEATRGRALAANREIQRLLGVVPVAGNGAAAQSTGGAAPLPSRGPDIETLFRVGGPAAKVLGLLLADEPQDEALVTREVSKNRALAELRGLASGTVTEDDTERWLRALREEA